MDIIKILSDIKGKALDTVHFELLKSAYELQNQNIEQLKNNNEALKENNNLLKEKVQALEKNKSGLEKKIGDIESKLTSIKDTNSQQELSEVAKAILHDCIKRDKSEFNDESTIRALSHFTRIQVETGIDELVRHRFVLPGSVMGGFGEGVDYDLTPNGKKFALKICSKGKS